MSFLKIMKLLWALPCSLIGLVVTATVLLAGGKARWSAGALEVTYRPSRASCSQWICDLPFRGVALGHVILAITAEELLIIGAHERVHVQQYERWGALFFIAYGLSSLWQMLHSRNPYWDNHFEIQARALSDDSHRPLA